MIARLLAALVALAFSSTALADGLVENVRGVTVDDEGRIARFEALLIGSDGRVLQLLQSGDKRPKKGLAFRLDGRGRILMPGLIATNVDMTRLGLTLVLAKPSVTRAQGEGPSGPPRPEDRDLAFVEAQQALLAAGITGVGATGATIEDWQSWRRAGDAGQLRMRLAAYAAGTEAMVLIGGPGPTPWLYDERLRLNGVALAYPGGADERLADTQLRNRMSRAAMDRFQVAVSVADPGKAAAVASAVAELSQTYKGDRRWRLLGANPAGPNGLIADSQLAIDDPAALDAPLKALTKSGEAAIPAWTSEAAKALFADGRFGRLVRGEQADFVLLGGDPFARTPSFSVRIVETWVGGKPVWREGE